MDDLDKIKKFKTDMDNIEVPTEIDFAIEKGLKKIEKPHRLKKFSVYFAAAAAVILLIALSPLKTWIQDFYFEKTMHVNSKGIAIVGSYGNLQSILKNYKSNIMVNGAMKSASKSSVSNASNDKQETAHSSTNVQVNGIDEPDVVKNDGKFIYSLSLKNNKLYIINAYPAQSIKVEASVSIDTKFHPSNMILKDNYLIIFGGYSMSTDNNNQAWYMWNNTKVLVYDVSDKKNPKCVKSLISCGEYNDARLIGNRVYVMSNEDINIGFNGMKKDDYKPFYIDSSLKGKEKRIDYKDIEYDPKATYPNYMVISSIDLSNINNEAKVTVMLGDGGNIYCNGSNLYFASRDENNKTIIYKFNLSDGKAIFQNKAEIEGSTRNQFSMDEYDGYLRVAVTKNNNGLVISKPSGTYSSSKQQMSSSIYVLDKNMKIISQISGIAKGEEIYSTRFIDDKAYVVTYKQTDPLFVVDLSNPARPNITGKLEMPGFSTYLQPYDQSHLIGFGRNSTEVSENGTVMVKPGNIKFAMFDVSDISKPKQMYKADIKDTDSYSDVLYNHRALLFDKNKEIMALPISMRDKDNKMTDGVYVYKVDLKNGFTFIGEVLNKYDTDALTYYGVQDVRAIYIGDTLYTVFDSKVVASDINNLNMIKEIELS